MAVGLLAVYALAQLNRDPDYAMSPALVRFHLLGLADFVVAVVTAGLAAGAIPALVGNGITTGAMDVWPMNLFPSFGVPVFIILQITAPLKIRELRRRAPSGYVGRLAPPKSALLRSTNCLERQFVGQHHMIARDVREVGECQYPHRPAQLSLEDLQGPGRAGLSCRRDPI